MEATPLKKSPQKTEAILLRGKRARDNIFWSVRRTTVRSVHSVKYLGPVGADVLPFDRYKNLRLTMQREMHGRITDA